MSNVAPSSGAPLAVEPSTEPKGDTSGWLTPQQLSTEWGKSLRWVRDHMTSGEIPSVKVGSQRWFTPECRAELVRRQVEQAKPDPWGRAKRGRAS